MAKNNLDHKIVVAFEETTELVKLLKGKYATLSDFEALKIALQIQKNVEIDKVNTTLQIAFGAFKGNQYTYLENIGEALEKISNALPFFRE